VVSERLARRDRRALRRTTRVTGAISSRAKIDELGKFTGEMEFFAQGENKAIAIRELAQKRDIDLNESFAYSDSETESPCSNRSPRLRRQRRSSTRQGGPRKSMADTEFQASGAGHDRTRSNVPYLLSALLIGVAAVLGRTYQRR